MDISQLLDALSVSFFALLGLWAGAARGHWFLRAAGVSSFLLIALLLPAYEPVIEFGLQMAIIALVVSAVRGRAPWRARWSLETVLLLTVVLAVVFAIVGSLPTFTAGDWLGMLGIGVITAMFALLCLWIVFGGVRLRWRLAGGVMGIALLLITLHFGSALQAAINNRNMRMGLQEIVLSYYDAQYMPIWFVWNGKTTIASFALVVSALFLARATGWFDRMQSRDPSADSRRPPTRMRLARAGVCIIFVSIGLPLFYVLYRLLTPPPFPPAATPTPNGYDDFIAASAKVPDATFERFIRRQDITMAELESLYTQVEPALALIDAGLSKACRVPYPLVDQAPADYQQQAAMVKCVWALMIRTQYLERLGRTRHFLDAVLKELRFGEESTRGSCANDWDILSEMAATSQLRGILGSLDSQACRRVAREVARFDQVRQPYEDRQAIQAIIDQHSDWQTRLNYLLTVWSGREPHAMDQWQQRQIAETRLLIADAALQAYTLENGRTPETLNRLVPEYLEQLPTDPFSSTPVKYLRNGSSYTVYSVGMDGDDDRGTRENQAFNGDIAIAGPHLHPLWTQLGEAAAAAWQKVQSLMPTTREGGASAQP